MTTTAPLTISPKIAAALLQAQRTVEGAQKTSTNTFHNYRYASAEEIVQVGRNALLGAGLFLVPVREDCEPVENPNDAWGGAVAILRAQYLLVHESGENFPISTDVPIVPERGRSSGWSRPLDKATFGARTEALSYMYRDLLSMWREDAPDVSGRRDGNRTGPGPRRDEEPPAQPAAAPMPPPTVPAYDQVLAAINAEGAPDRKVRIWYEARKAGLPAADLARLEQPLLEALGERFSKLDAIDKVNRWADTVTRWTALSATARGALDASLAAARARCQGAQP